MLGNALGLIETKGLIGAIVATDAAAKAAAVVISSGELTPGTFFTIKIEGELGAVQAAVKAATEAAEKICELVAAHIIARPDSGLLGITPLRRYVSKYHSDDDRPPYDSDGGVATPEPKAPRPTSSSTPRRRPRTSAPRKQGFNIEATPASRGDLEAMSVVQLRQYARTLEQLPLRGRQISAANKQQLVEEISSLFGWG
jgi:ethanolamine utilization protein EutM